MAADIYYFIEYNLLRFYVDEALNLKYNAMSPLPQRHCFASPSIVLHGHLLFFIEAPTDAILLP